MKKVRIDDNVTEIKSKPFEPKHSPTLIPSDTVDEAFQRMFIVSLFVLLQAWKIYDVIVVNDSLDKFTFIVKYAFIDGIFLWFLPILNIPYLVFPPLVTLLMTILFNIVNIILINKVSLMFIFTVPYIQLPKKELTFGEVSTGAIDIDSHFKGKYTIHYLPDSLAKFNVFNLQGCQDDSIPFHIPIEFNTTTDITFLEIQYTSPKNKVSYQQYSHSDISKLLRRDYSHLRANKEFVNNDERVFYMEIPAREPGEYKLNKIRDGKGSSIRYIQNSFSFAHCPNAQFISPKSVTSKMCVGKKPDDISMKLPLLTLEGAEPLRCKISATFNGKQLKVIDTDISVSDILPYNVTKVYSHQLTRNLLEQEILKDPTILQVTQSGNLEFQLLEVTDSLGNSKKYNPQADTPDVRYNLELLTIPSVRLIEMDKQSPLLVNGTKGISFAASKNIIEQLPLTARVNFEHPQDSLRSYNFTHEFKTLEDLRKGIQITNPGTYKLLSVFGSYCACEIQDSSINIELVEPPTLDIIAHPLIDKCVGMTGYKFEFEASGTGPFIIEYTVFQNSSNYLRPLPGPQGRIERLLKSESNKFDFDYKPPGEGSYVIKFKTIRDYNYKQSPVLLDDALHTYSTYFKQRSRVSFFNQRGSLQKIFRTCQGESTQIPIYFNGNFPFRFDYSIVDGNNKPIISKTDVVAKENPFELNTNDLTKGGQYKIVLSNILDGSSCPVDFNEAETIQLITRSDIPEIGFDTKSETTSYKILEGDSIDVPLTIKSSVKRTSNDKIEYEFINTNGVKTIKSVQGQGSLRLNLPGQYKLISFTNGGCKGKVSNQKVIEISLYDRPNISVEAAPNQVEQSSKNNLILRSGCQNCHKEVSVHLSGKPPFIVDYEIKFPSGRIEPRTMTTEKNSLVINLPSAQSGLYQHKFKGVYDGLYSKPKGFKGGITSVSYNIHEVPSIEFEKSLTVQLCEAMLGQKVPELGDIPIKLIGKAPFSVNVTISGEKNSKTFTIGGIQDKYLNLNQGLSTYMKQFKQGEYIIEINEVEDGNGCINKEINQSTQIVISVTPSPDINPLVTKKVDYCVGEHVGYNLIGAAPFTLYYDFNNKTYESKSDTQFRRFAAKPGIIQVTGIEDSSSGSCLIKVPKGSKKSEVLEVHIHDLPSVEINQGDTIIRDINEGDLTDMKFTFTGTPPFTVTYTRTLYGKSGKKTVETKTIPDIMEHEYTVMVGLEGTYEAIEIRDAYCVAKKEI